jgi:hypothetical protein
VSEGEIVSPCEGVACYRNPANGFFVMVTHFHADKQKRGDWADRKRRGYMDPLDFEIEHSLEFWGLGARATYWAFGRHNIVKAGPVPEDAEIYLSFDFGQVHATAVYFYAQDKKTKEIVIFDEIYVTEKNAQLLGLVKNSPTEVAGLIYKKMAEHLGLNVATMKMSDVVKLSVGDPSGAQYAASYADCPWPIAIMTRGFKLPFNLNRREPGEAKVNELLRPTAYHCERKWFSTECGICDAKLTPKPLLTVMEGRAPNLVRTWPLIKKPKEDDGLEADEKDAPKQEDHGPDSVRYLMQFLYFEMPGGENKPRAIEDTPSELLTSVERRAKIRRLAARESERAERGVESDVMYAASEPLYSYGDGELKPDGLAEEELLAAMG